MKALTVWQPWASLLVLGIKRNETRSWRTNYTGDLLIHAAKTPVDAGLSIMDPKTAHLVLELFQGKTGNLPTGAIIGKCRLMGCIQVTESIRDALAAGNPTEYTLGDYSIGRYSWMMDKAAFLEEPIPASGKQGLWNYEGELGELKERHERYKEIIVLKHLLQEKGIPFDLEPLLDGYHIGVPTIHGFGADQMKYSIIEHFGSYGSAFDLLEIIGPGGSLQGFLKADAVAQMVENERRAGHEKT